MHSPFQELKTAFLVGSYRSSEMKGLCEEYLTELERLCDTYGLKTVEKIACPIRTVEAATYLGKGKIEELAQSAQDQAVDVVIFDDEITPQQQRNLEAIFKRAVIDRTELILEVFAQRAQSREARLQIELARVRYQLPRLRRLWTHLGRQTAGGKGFTKGEGEQQIELDRRMLRRRIDRLKEELNEVIANREIQRSARLRSKIPTFAIVGYTNAGKSTLLRSLTKADVLVEDKLFATLDTTTRKFVLPNRQEILLIDTVGFIRKIPHMLVAAFKSTLEEAMFTDILLHLIDVSHPMAEQQAEESIAVLKELGALNRPIITVLNKIDRCQDLRIVQKMRIKYPKTVQISSLTRAGFEELLELMTKEISALRKVVKVKIPQSHYALISQLMRDGRVLETSYEGNDVLLHVEIPHFLTHRVEPFLL